LANVCPPNGGERSTPLVSHTQTYKAGLCLYGTVYLLVLSIRAGGSLDSLTMSVMVTICCCCCRGQIDSPRRRRPYKATYTRRHVLCCRPTLSV